MDERDVKQIVEERHPPVDGQHPSHRAARALGERERGENRAQRHEQEEE